MVLSATLTAFRIVLVNYQCHTTNFTVQFTTVTTTLYHTR